VLRKLVIEVCEMENGRIELCERESGRIEILRWRVGG
jgi:hypothetical protein